MYEHIRNFLTINKTQYFIPKIKPDNNIMSITLIEKKKSQYGTNQGCSLMETMLIFK